MKLKTRVIEYNEFYIPQYRSSILFIKFWTDYSFLVGPMAFSCMFNTKEEAEKFLQNINCETI